MGDSETTDATPEEDEARASLLEQQEQMKKLMGEMEHDFDPNSQGFRDRTDAAFRNAREAIKDPHVQQLIELSMNMDAKTPEEIKQIGRAMRAAQRLEGEAAAP